MERRQSTLNSQCHSVFNGWQLIAQQDRYQQLKHTIDGNIVEWIFETSYAVCQPNGQVLALLNPKGRTLWRKEKQTLWGLYFPNEYKQPSPLDPQLLFAGQWVDEESGLVYNRFRYYDPESGNYISSDPIGLSGGERPFGYVGNPLDWFDAFGLAGCWQKYEQQIQDLYGGKTAFKSRKYSAIIDGKRVNGVADNITKIAGNNIAIEAKYVDNWAKSIRNPASKIGGKDFALKEQAKVLEQAKKYSKAFKETIYHTNSKEFAEYYRKIFEDAGINNVRFEIIPFIK